MKSCEGQVPVKKDGDSSPPWLHTYLTPLGIYGIMRVLNADWLGSIALFPGSKTVSVVANCPLAMAADLRVEHDHSLEEERD